MGNAAPEKPDGSAQLNEILVKTEPAMPSDHAPPHQAILNLGHAEVHYIRGESQEPVKKKRKGKKDKEAVLSATKHKSRIQHGHYYFVPRMQYFVELDAGARSGENGDMVNASQKARALLYVKPGQTLEKRSEGKRLYFVTKQKKKTTARVKVAALEPVVDERAPSPDTPEPEPVAPAPADEPEVEEKAPVDFFRDSELDNRLTALESSTYNVVDTTKVLESDEEEGDNTTNNSECLLCATDAMVDPLIAECKHICCNECWMTWLDETKDTGGACPECEEPVDEEHLYPVALCSMCQLSPTEPWKAPCGHQGCRTCWTSWIKEQGSAPNCPACYADFEKEVFPYPLS